MRSKKTDLSLLFRASPSDDRPRQKHTSHNQNQNESPSHDKACQPFTDGVLSIFPFRRQKSTLFCHFRTLPTQPGHGPEKTHNHTDGELQKRALNRKFKAPEGIRTRIGIAMDLRRLHPNQNTHPGREAIHV